MSQRYLATSGLGLERALLNELRGMKIKKPKVVTGGVEFQATRRGLYEVMQWGRIPQRVYLRVDEFRTRDIREVYRKTRRFEWERLIDGTVPIAARGHVQQSRIGGTGELVSGIADGLRDHFREDLGRPAPEVREEERATTQDDTALALMARCVDDRCQLNLGATQRLMHKRGWRTDTGPAPLRETLAAALLQIAEWTPDEALVDPMCGLGTISIEAARLARGLRPRIWPDDDYAVTHWANFDADLWDEIAELHRDDFEGDGVFFASDRDSEVLESARANAARAELPEDAISFTQQDVAQMRPPEDVAPGVILCNPPYGERLDDEGAIEALIQTWKAHWPGWRLALLAPKQMYLSPHGLKHRAEIVHGGLDVFFWVSGDS